MNYNRPKKNAVRDCSLDFMNNRVSGDSVWFPGPQATCVLQAMNMGILSDGNTILVEQDSSVINKFEPLTRDLPNPLIHGGPLSTLVLPNNVSKAFFDFNGWLDEETIHWLDQIFKPKMLAGGTYVINLLYGYRSNGIPKKLRKYFKSTEIYNSFRSEMMVNDELITRTSALLHCIFDELDVSFKQPIRYRDTVDMVTYPFELISDQPKPRHWPTVNEIFDSIGVVISDKSGEISPQNPEEISPRSNRRVNMSYSDQMKGLVKFGVITDGSRRAYDANRTRKHAAIERDISLSAGSKAAKKAWVTMNILASAKSRADLIRVNPPYTK